MARQRRAEERKRGAGRRRASAVATPKRKPGAPDDDRASRSAARRGAILAAALEEFSVGGFAATRLEDVARRAGIAKGTIYLYFSDKETLFQELLHSMFAPLVGALSKIPVDELPARELAERMIALFIREVLGTRRKDVIRLIIAEGPRFPKLAEFHYREVMGRVLPMLGALLKRAAARGEVDPRLAQFPQLLVAPGIVAIVWKALFERLAPLDVEAMMKVHLDLLFGPRKIS
jgi:AcrR family transcriptional regulator